MVNMKKIIALLLTAVMAAAFAVTLSAEPASEQRVFDNADLFSIEEEAVIEDTVKDFITTTNMDCVVLTSQDSLGNSAMETADDFYDYGGFGIGEDASGMLFLIDMDNREIYISTSGEAIDYLYDSRIDNLLDYAYEDVSNEDYAGAAVVTLIHAKEYIASGVKGEGRVDTDKEGFPSIGEWIIVALISLAVASIAGAIACANVKGKYKMTAGGHEYNFRENADALIVRRQDDFVNQTLTSHRIETTSSSGGGHSSGRSSSVHRSSSGRSHGGGGRRF